MKNVSVSFERLKNDFLTQMEVAKYTYATIRTYKYPLDDFLSFLGNEGVDRIQDATRSHLEKYRLKLRRSDFKPNSMETYLKTVKLFFKHLESTGVIFINTADDMVVPSRDKNLGYVPTIEDMELFLNMDVSTPTRLRNKALFETAYSSGGRLNELRMLNLKDCDLAQEELKLFGKGRRERVVPIGRTAVHWLNEYIKEARPLLSGTKKDDALFLSRYGNRISGVGIQKQIRHRQKETDSRVTMHAMRRACATHMLQGGAHPMEIQKLLGHADLSNISRYFKVLATDLKETHERSLR